MRKTKALYSAIVIFGVVAVIAACAMQMGGEQSTSSAVRIDNDDIGGVVTST
jgi:hypothetical protein